MRITTNTRSTILKNSLELFSTHGYFDTTTKEISNKCHINETTLFYHFPDKASIYQAVVDKYYQGSTKPLSEVNKKLKFENIETDLYALAIAYSEMTMSNIHILHIMLGRIPLTPEIKQESYYILPAIREHLNQYLMKAVDNKLISSNDYSYACEIFLSHICRLIMDMNIHDNITKLNDEIRQRLYSQLLRMSRFYAENFFNSEAPL